MTRLSEIGEFEALRRLMRGRTAHPSVLLGPGDDAAVLRPAPGMDLVATTDAFVEGRHFLAGPDPAEVGARLAVANLSDLAAMAAIPRWALVSIGVRADHEVETLEALERGIEQALGGDGAVVVGGNLTASGDPEWLSLTLLGEVARGREWTRGGARAGDLIATSGSPGRSGAGLRLARAAGGRAGGEWGPLFDAWLRPRSRVVLAQALAASGAVTAAIDISDGLLGDLGHLCEASGVGAEIDAAAGAGDTLLARAARELGMDPFALYAGPSDDYELILAVDPARREACELAARSAGAALAFIGRLTDAPGAIARVSPDGARHPLDPAGFDHFTSR